MPDYACVVVGSNMGVTRMTKEHIGMLNTCTNAKTIRSLFGLENSHLCGHYQD